MKKAEITVAALEKDGTLITRLLEMLLTEGYREKVSDIHLEPGENDLRIRMRIDGSLREYMTLEKEYHLPLIARTKVLSGLDP